MTKAAHGGTKCCSRRTGPKPWCRRDVGVVEEVQQDAIVGAHLVAKLGELVHLAARLIARAGGQDATVGPVLAAIEVVVAATVEAQLAADVGDEDATARATLLAIEADQLGGPLLAKL